MEVQCCFIVDFMDSKAVLCPNNPTFFYLDAERRPRAVCSLHDNHEYARVLTRNEYIVQAVLEE